MSPRRREGSIVKINKDRLKAVLNEKNIKQKGLAELLNTSEAYLSRIIARGEIDIDWMNKICEYLNIPISYLTGESNLSPVSSDPYYVKHLEYNKDQYELKKVGKRHLLDLFLKACGYDQEGLCDNLTEKELLSISVLVSFSVVMHVDIYKEFMETLQKNEELEIRIKELEEKLANISTEESEEKGEAAANNNKNERS